VVFPFTVRVTSFSANRLTSRLQSLSLFECRLITVTVICLYPTLGRQYYAWTGNAVIDKSSSVRLWRCDRLQFIQYRLPGWTTVSPWRPDAGITCILFEEWAVIHLFSVTDFITSGTDGIKLASRLTSLHCMTTGSPIQSVHGLPPGLRLKLGSAALPHISITITKEIRQVTEWTYHYVLGIKTSQARSQAVARIADRTAAQQ